MIFRSKAPLRIGLAGGGTDVSPYCDQYGGAILNATISLYAYATIEEMQDDGVHFHSIDLRESRSFKDQNCIDEDVQALQLLKGVHSYFKKRIGTFPSGYSLTTYVDAPGGSGLGTSSTLMVAIIGAYAKWLKIPMGEYDIAKLAYEIERKQLNMAGGKQDQYAAAFGGVNFMEFYKDEQVIVNPLVVKEEYLHELNHNLLLYYTDSSRLSSEIISLQSENVKKGNSVSIDAMHELKKQATMMKEALLMGRVNDIGEILDYGFRMKKQMAHGISNTFIEDLYERAKGAGATGGKISGAGGGGFMVFYCPGNSKYKVMNALLPLKGKFRNYQFVPDGVKYWSI